MSRDQHKAVQIFLGVLLTATPVTLVLAATQHPTRLTAHLKAPVNPP
jgi:hypothetical protein